MDRILRWDLHPDEIRSSTHVDAHVRTGCRGGLESDGLQPGTERAAVRRWEPLGRREVELDVPGPRSGRGRCADLEVAEVERLARNLLPVHEDAQQRRETGESMRRTMPRLTTSGCSLPCVSRRDDIAASQPS